MTSIFLIGTWILATITIVSFAGILGKKYGKEHTIAILAALTVMASIFANKIVEVGTFTVPAGVIVFSMTFLITDIIAETWGKQAAQNAVWTGFYANIVLVISVLIVTHWQAPIYMQEAAEIFNQAIGLTWRITVAGLITYLISQSHDVWAYHFWKQKTKGKHLWLRNNASTIISQFIDSVLFITIAFYGILPIWPLILGQWIIKIIIAIAETPFLYATRWMMKKI